MKKSRLLFIAGALLLASCGSNSEGELIKDNTRTGVTNALSFSQEYSGKRIALVGYLGFDNNTTYEVGKPEIRMSFTTQPGGEGDLLNWFKVNMGEGKNEVQIPKGTNAKRNFNMHADESTIDVTKIVLTTNSGAKVPLTQKLKVSGTVKYTKDFSTGKTMEMPVFGSDKKGFVYELEDVRFDEVK